MAKERTRNREESQALEPPRHPLSRLGMWPIFSPFGMMRRFAEEMDRMFEGAGVPGRERMGPWFAGDHFSPEIDVFESDGKLVISADLPGLAKDDVKVDVMEDSVI